MCFWSLTKKLSQFSHNIRKGRPVNTAVVSFYTYIL